MEKGARAILKSGIPEAETPGFWNNVGQCCGSAGVADFLLSLYEINPNPEYLDFARKLTKDLLARASSDETGSKWIHAEHRSRPEFLQAQTGLMQGGRTLTIRKKTTLTDPVIILCYEKENTCKTKHRIKRINK